MLAALLKSGAESRGFEVKPVYIWQRTRPATRNKNGAFDASGCTRHDCDKDHVGRSISTTFLAKMAEKSMYLQYLRHLVSYSDSVALALLADFQRGTFHWPCAS